MTHDAGAAVAPGMPTLSDVTVERGLPMPFGATRVPGGVNFSVFSRHGSAVTLDVFDPRTGARLLSVTLDPRFNRTGDVWHVMLRNLEPQVSFGWRVAGSGGDPRFDRFNPEISLIDPYVRAVAGGSTWGQPGKRIGQGHDTEFDWGTDQPLRIPLADSIIYELHVRGYTRDPSSLVALPGTFLGLTEKIPHLKQLGITAVELLPVTEFDETENVRTNPRTGERLLNYWGYNPVAFFSPKRSYAVSDDPVTEFKQMVKRFHAAGIEVILDMVLNHTAEGNHLGPTLSWRGFDNQIYYMLDPVTGAYRDYTGVGNTLNCNHPVVRQLILDCLRYWVLEMHVDGFRFDLASVLGRGRDGEVLVNPPIIEQIAEDPILAHTKLIAEAWDAAGLYQVGSFPAWGRWAEWNGHFRDDVRRFVRGDPGQVSALATRLAGSAELYERSSRAPWHGINFVTCHDGFTLRDLVSYQEKHNEENGEDSRDGIGENFSWNCGVEGPTTNRRVRALRLRQMKNFAALLFVAQGVPMVLAGDEFGRTQRGNNNAYCHDSTLTWIDWNAKRSRERGELLRFFTLLMALRRTQPGLRRRRFDPEPGEGPWIEWHGVHLGQPDWSWTSRSLAMFLRAVKGQASDHLYLIANAWWEPLDFELPAHGWRRVLDTSLPSPDDIAPPGAALPLSGARTYRVDGRSVVVLIAPR